LNILPYFVSMCLSPCYSQHRSDVQVKYKIRRTLE
jgi:hypothetical protein